MSYVVRHERRHRNSVALAGTCEKKHFYVYEPLSVDPVINFGRFLSFGNQIQIPGPQKRKICNCCQVRVEADLGHPSYAVIPLAFSLGVS